MRKKGFKVILCFSVSFHKKDLNLLDKMKAYFNEVVAQACKH